MQSLLKVIRENTGGIDAIWGEDDYIWSISKANTDWEVLELVDYSDSIKNGEKHFKTANSAYKAGLKELKSKYKKGVYMLEVSRYNYDKMNNNYEEEYTTLIIDGKIQ